MDDDGNSILDLYFMFPHEYGFSFQLLYFLTIEQQLRTALKNHSTSRIIICERSLLTARDVYVPLLGSNMTTCEKSIYQMLFQKEGVRHILPDHVVFLDTEPNKCIGNVTHKNRLGGEIINMKFLEKCYQTHKGLIGKTNSEFTSVKSDPNHLELTIREIRNIISNQNSQEMKDSDKYLFEPEKPKIICVEGNVGSGKSSLLDTIGGKMEERGITKIQVMKEPVSEWERVTDGSKTILELFYEKPYQYAMAFQTLVAITSMKKMEEIIDVDPDTEVIICERSLRSSEKVFAEYLRDSNSLDTMQLEIYKEIFKGEGHTWMYPSETIYLEVDPTICMSRIQSRKRPGEEGITLKWLTEHDEYYWKFLKEDSAKSLLIIRGNTHNPSIRDDCAEMIIQRACLYKEKDIMDMVIRGIYSPAPIGVNKTIRNVDMEEDIEDEEDSDFEEIRPEIEIKLRSGEVNRYVNITEYKFEQLVTKAKEVFPDLVGKDIWFTWTDDNRESLAIQDDDELETAVLGMTLVRPILRMQVMILPEQENHEEQKNDTICQTNSEL